MPLLELILLSAPFFVTALRVTHVVVFLSLLPIIPIGELQMLRPSIRALQRHGVSPFIRPSPSLVFRAPFASVIASPFGYKTHTDQSINQMVYLCTLLWCNRGMRSLSAPSKNNEEKSQTKIGMSDDNKWLPSWLVERLAARAKAKVAKKRASEAKKKAMDADLEVVRKTVEKQITADTTTPVLSKADIAVP
jgi:hypothetical protein